MSERKNFFVSYNKADKNWAKWIAGTLEENGYTVILQAWDFKPGHNFILQMQKAVNETEKSIIVLSQNYLDSEYCQSEWAAEFSKDPTGEKTLLIPVRVSNVTPNGLLSNRIYIDLYDVDEDTAIQKILYGVGSSFNPRKKPKYPGVKNSFPGNVHKKPDTSQQIAPIETYNAETGITKSDFVEKHLLSCFIKATLNLTVNDDINTYVRCIVVKFDYNQQGGTRHTVLECGRGRTSTRQRVGTRSIKYGVVGVMNKEKAAILHDFKNDICYRMTDANYRTIPMARTTRGTVDDRLALLVAPIWKDSKIWGALSFDFFDIGEDESLRSKNIINLIADAPYLRKVLHNASFFSEVISSFLFNKIISGGKDFL